MITSTTAIELIKKHEGYRKLPYRDAAGILTIGYGHSIVPGKDDFIRSMTPEVAEQVLREDVKIAESCIDKNVTVPLNQNQYDALVSFIFNIGCPKFIKSTLLAKLNKLDYKGASQEFVKWSFVDGIFKNGLHSRRFAEMRLFNKKVM